MRLDLDRDLRRVLDVPAPVPPLAQIHMRAARAALRERLRRCVFGALVALAVLCVLPTQHAAQLHTAVGQSVLPHPQPAPAPSA